VNKGSIVKEGIGVLTGQVSFSQLVMWIFSTAIFEILFVTGVENMFELFYIPENMIGFTIAMVIGGLLGALGWACMMKAEFGKDEPWKMKYVASMFVTMVIAPIVTSLILGAIFQKFYPDVNDVFYDFALIICTFAIARYVLLFFNVGLKATVRMLKGDVKTAKDTVGDVKEIAGDVKEVADSVAPPKI